MFKEKIFLSLLNEESINLPLLPVCLVYFQQDRDPSPHGHQVFQYLDQQFMDA